MTGWMLAKDSSWGVRAMRLTFRRVMTPASARSAAGLAVRTVGGAGDRSVSRCSSRLRAVVGAGLAVAVAGAGGR